MYEHTELSRELRYEAPSHLSLSTWPVMLEVSLSRRAQEIACAVAERLRDPDVVHATAERARQQSLYSVVWFAPAVASGDVGLALLYEYLDRCFPDQGWGACSQRYFRLAATASQQAALTDFSLFSGTAGMTLALALASRGGTRYQKTLQHLRQGLCVQVLQQEWRRPDAADGVSDSEYDLVSGASGLLVSLISLEQPDEAVFAAIDHLLAYLLWLAEPGQPVGKERWYSPPALLPTERHRKTFPQGNFNCGLAHGIPGPLAALSLAWLAGYRKPGLRESIAYLAWWVETHQVHTPWGMDWPDSVAREHAFHPQDWQRLEPTRSAWCYGAPGVARSLWLAGMALDDAQVCQVALEAIETVFRRPEAERALPSAHLCHGLGGLLQICLRFAHVCPESQVRTQIPVLVEQILTVFDPASALGFSNFDEGQPLARADWLTGTAGIALALLAASMPILPTWDRLLAIS